MAIFPDKYVKTLIILLLNNANMGGIFSLCTQCCTFFHFTFFTFFQFCSLFLRKTTQHTIKFSSEIKFNSIHKNKKTTHYTLLCSSISLTMYKSGKKKVLITKTIRPRLAVSSNMCVFFFNKYAFVCGSDTRGRPAQWLQLSRNEIKDKILKCHYLAFIKFLLLKHNCQQCWQCYNITALRK